MSDEIGFVLLLLFFANPIIVLKKSSRQPLLEFLYSYQLISPTRKQLEAYQPRLFHGVYCVGR